MATRRWDRIRSGISRWRTRSATTIELRPDLSNGKLGEVEAAIEDGISNRGGEVAGRLRAQQLAIAYRELDLSGRLRFCELLAERFGFDDAAIGIAIAAVPTVANPTLNGTSEPPAVGEANIGERERRYRELSAALEPRYRTLLRRFASMEDGFRFLIRMREDVMTARRDNPALTELDHELHDLLASWFDVSLLQLERLTWETPASTLELLIRYEAVHEITSWDDLRRRLGTGRRCYAFMHPAMPGDPLIFVEVALTDGMADSVEPFISPPDPTAAVTNDGGERDGRADEAAADTAIFYSISNCHRGLAGVSLGDFLIKSVAQALATELPNLERFATLSPLPGFHRWLTGALEDPDRLTDLGTDERHTLSELANGPIPDLDDPRLEAAKPTLLRLAAEYVVLARRPDGRALDPVENFHLSNGARAERLNWMANPTPNSWERGLGMMINYRYRLQNIERNHDLYTNSGEVVAAPAVTALLPGPK